jgi:hypothetical protein
VGVGRLLVPKGKRHEKDLEEGIHELEGAVTKYGARRGSVDSCEEKESSWLCEFCVLWVLGIGDLVQPDWREEPADQCDC